MPIEPLLILLTGLVFGSFITMASYRLPRGEEMVRKRSRCTNCDTALSARDLFPVLSWAMARGKCRHCSAKVSARYPLIELVTAGVFLLIHWRYGVGVPAVVLALMAVALLVMIVVDIEHYIIPDEIHIALLPLGLFYHWLINTPWEDALYGFLIGAGLGLLLHHGYRFIRKKEGLGFGDVKFLAVAGLWLTPLPFVPFLFFSGVLGVVNGLIWRALGKGPLFPFGPSLAMALFVCVAFPEIPNLFWRMGELVR